MTVMDTSLEAYFDVGLQRTFGSQREKVLFIVASNPGSSSSDVARIGNLTRNAVTGRLNELEKKGFIHKAHKKLDPVTNTHVYTYEVGPTPKEVLE